MAKDRHGKKIERGDKVLVPAVVTDVYGDAEHAEIHVEPSERHHRGHKTLIPLSSSQVEAVKPPPPSPPVTEPSDASGQDAASSAGAGAEGAVDGPGAGESV